MIKKDVFTLKTLTLWIGVWVVFTGGLLAGYLGFKNLSQSGSSPVIEQCVQLTDLRSVL